MDLVHRSDLRTLMRPYPGPCVSIFLPTHRAGEEVRQDPIRFGNLLRDAEGRLLEMGLRRPEAGEFLAPAEALLKDPFFWRHQGDGLAVFLGAGIHRRFRLPIEVQELVVVSDRFHVRPLLSLLTGDCRYYLLALSQNEIRLLQGTRHRVDEVDLEDVPDGLAGALKLDDGERQLQFHTRTPSSGGRRPAIFHGHGAEDDAKDRILRYFRQIDAGLRDVLSQETAPLVLAGVEYLFPIYREANTYAHLLGEGVAGNPEELRPEELHRRAWPVVEPHFRAERESSSSRYRQLAGTGRTAADPLQIVEAAIHGRVEVLFVAAGEHVWGTIDPETAEVRMREGEPEAGDEDLLDLSAIHTFLNGGAVYAPAADDLPEIPPAAAILRY